MLDRDDRLVGEGFEQRDLLVGEGPHLLAVEEDRADGHVLVQQWRGHDRAMAEPLLVLAALGQLALHGLGEVRHVNRATVHDGAADGVAAGDRQAVGLVQGAVDQPRGGDGPQAVAIHDADAGAVRGALTRGVGGDLVEHLLDLARRAGDAAQHLVGRRLLRQRLGEVARALGDALLQRRVRLAQAGRHDTERLGHLADLVARPHVDLLVEIALGDAARGDGEPADAPHHGTRE